MNNKLINCPKKHCYEYYIFTEKNSEKNWNLF